MGGISSYFVAILSIISATNAFLPLCTSHVKSKTSSTTTTTHQMSFMADSSDYKQSNSDFGDGDKGSATSEAPLRGEVDLAEVPVTEEIPVPMSRNNVGNRFVAVVYDRIHSTKDYTSEDESDGDNDQADMLWGMHNDRIELTEEHVMWARKQNLYNDTFNTESMADILWSHQLLSSDLQRTIGHVMCVDASTMEDCREALSRDPIIRSLLGTNDKNGECDVSSIPLYRWRQIRDHTLRRDDGRDGRPNMLLAFDRKEAMSDGVREEVTNDHLEYLIRSERIIAAGPLHVATAKKTDPKSIPIGTLLFFNSPDRDEAIDFVQNDPAALAGLYETMSVHRFNNLDVTGKFVSENLYFPKQNTYQMKEAMEYWGYPVEDQQTKWLNW